jgi:hypothetical protein
LPSGVFNRRSWVATTRFTRQHAQSRLPTLYRRVFAGERTRELGGLRGGGETKTPPHTSTTEPGAPPTTSTFRAPRSPGPAAPGARRSGAVGGLHRAPRRRPRACCPRPGAVPPPRRSRPGPALSERPAAGSERQPAPRAQEIPAAAPRKAAAVAPPRAPAPRASPRLAPDRARGASPY